MATASIDSTPPLPQPTPRSNWVRNGAIATLTLAAITALGFVVAAHFGIHLLDILQGHAFYLDALIGGSIGLVAAIVAKVAHSVFATHRERIQQVEATHTQTVLTEQGTLVRHEQGMHSHTPLVQEDATTTTPYTLNKKQTALIATVNTNNETVGGPSESTLNTAGQFQVFVRCQHETSPHLHLSRTEGASAQVSFVKIGNDTTVNIFTTGSAGDLNLERIAATIRAEHERRYQSLFDTKTSLRQSGWVAFGNKFIVAAWGSTLIIQPAEAEQLMADAIVAASALLTDDPYLLFVQTEHTLFVTGNMNAWLQRDSDPQTEIVINKQGNVAVFRLSSLRYASFVGGNAEFVKKATPRNIGPALANKVPAERMLKGALLLANNEYRLPPGQQRSPLSPMAMACMVFHVTPLSSPTA